MLARVCSRISSKLAMLGQWLLDGSRTPRALLELRCAVPGRCGAVHGSRQIMARPNKLRIDSDRSDLRVMHDRATPLLRKARKQNCHLHELPSRDGRLRCAVSEKRMLREMRATPVPGAPPHVDDES
jgi:hypothetical protein